MRSKTTLPARGLAAVCFAIAIAAFPSAANDFLKNLPQDTWYQAPDTRMRKVCASLEQFSTLQGVGACDMVMEAWGGGAYDESRKRMWIWGGGHADYWGNELYAFDVETLKWSRVTDPSVVERDKLSTDPMPDGNPVSRHTYDGLAFITSADRLFAFGGSMAGNGFGTPVTWTFDPVALKWTNRQPSGNENRPQFHCCNFTAEYDPHSRNVIMRDPEWVVAYDYQANTWTRLREWNHSWEPAKAVIDTKRRLHFTIGSGEFLVYDIKKNADVSADWKATGGEEVIKTRALGAAYDEKSDRIMAWIGAGVYTLDLDKKTWMRMSGVGAPERPLQNGTFGRFRYLRDENVFMLMNGVDQNVYFYKFQSGAFSSIRPRPALKPPMHALHPGPYVRAADGRRRKSGQGIKGFAPAFP